MSGNVIEFPNSKVTVAELVADLSARAAAGEIQHLLVVTMDHKTETKCAMSTVPAYHAVFMNQLQRLTIEALMRAGGMVP